MIDPVDIHDLMASAVSGALVILFGAAYALCFAYARLRQRPALMALALVAYAALAAAVLVLSRTLHLTGFWQWVTAVMLVGYFLAPRLVWHLCAGTHAGGDPRASEISEDSPLKGGLSP